MAKPALQKQANAMGIEAVGEKKEKVITGCSGHADHDGLLAWAGAMRKKPSRTFVVHGEEESAKALAEALRIELKFENVEIPNPHQSVTI